MAVRVAVGELANAVMKELDDYAKLVTEDMKKAVKKAGTSVKKEIQANAPKDSGAYAKSWSVKNMKENSHALELTVYSRNRCQLAHLLEFGHAKREVGVSPEGRISPLRRKQG